MIDGEDTREYSATFSAHQFLLEILLSNLLDRYRDNAEEVIATILRVGAKFDHLRADDDATAEMLSDIAVRTNQVIETIVARARERAGV